MDKFTRTVKDHDVFFEDNKVSTKICHVLKNGNFRIFEFCFQTPRGKWAIFDIRRFVDEKKIPKDKIMTEHYLPYVAEVISTYTYENFINHLTYGDFTIDVPQLDL